MQVLQVNNVSMDFNGIKALTDININIESSKITGIIGPNGAGKTTLFNLLTGIYEPSHGKIVYNMDGRIYDKKLKPYEMAGIGVARTFQNIRLFKDMTVIDNVKIGFEHNIKYGLLSSILRLPSFYKEEKRIEEMAHNYLEIFKLSDKVNELAKNLPYGEQRKLEIIRALAEEPKILLLDEPAAGMNQSETKELMELIKLIKEKFKITIIMIEHDMTLIMGVCEEIFVLNYGKLIAQGTPKEIQSNPDVISAYLGGEIDA